MINWEGCNRKDMCGKNGGVDGIGGAGDPNELASSWLSLWMPLLGSLTTNKNRNTAEFQTLWAGAGIVLGPVCCWAWVTRLCCSLHVTSSHPRLVDNVALGACSIFSLVQLLNLLNPVTSLLSYALFTGSK